MKDVSFGQYYPVESIIHRLDPRFKFLISICYIVMIFYCKTYTAYFACFLFVVAVSIMSRIPFSKVLKSVRALIIIMAMSLVLNMFFTASKESLFELPLFDHTIKINNQLYNYGVIHITMTGIDLSLKMCCRLSLIVMGPSLLMMTTTPMEITDGLESLLSPLKLIKFPVHTLTMIMSIALRLIPTITEETQRIMLAQKARCADFDSRNIFKKAKAMLPLLIPLFVSSLRRAEDLAYAMDSRCYKGAKGRTKRKKLNVRVADFVATFTMICFSFGILLVNFNWFNFGFLTMLL